jgi:hypothetical protein
VYRRAVCIGANEQNRRSVARRAFFEIRKEAERRIFCEHNYCDPPPASAFVGRADHDRCKPRDIELFVFDRGQRRTRFEIAVNGE